MSDPVGTREPRVPQAYVEVVERATNAVVERIDVTHYTARGRDRVERGVQINLNREDYYTRQIEED